jgi:hypothetical protein
MEIKMMMMMIDKAAYVLLCKERERERERLSFRWTTLGRQTDVGAFLQFLWECVRD